MKHIHGVALATGFRSRSGRALAFEAAQRYSDLLLVDCNARWLSAMLNLLTASGYSSHVQLATCDIASAELRIVLEYLLNGRRIDHVVHCASMAAADADVEAEAIFQQNVSSLMGLLTAALPHMNAGSQVTISVSPTTLRGPSVDAAISGAISSGRFSELDRLAPNRATASALSMRAAELIIERERRRFEKRGCLLEIITPAALVCGSLVLSESEYRQE